jgi:hypothetical protein
MKEINILDQRVPTWIHKETTMETLYSVVLADSHDMVRQEVRRIIEAMGDMN